MIDVSGITAFIYEYRYFAIFGLAFAEGPVVSLILGFLVSLGSFELIPTLGALVLGDLVPDTSYYYIGRLGHSKKFTERYINKFDFLKRNFSLLEGLWKIHPQKTMFLAKLAYGIATPLLISAGLVQMKLKRFLRLSLPVTFFQYGILFSIGYVFGDSYNRFIKYIFYGEYILGGLALAFFIGYIFFIRYARNQLIRLEENERKNIK
jgi:membrane protein DedA with SNARE-associated domain